MPKFKFDKLVRDKILDHQLNSGAKPKYRVLNKTEHVRALIDKISEEAAEIIAAKPEDQAAEIADVQQAIDDLKSQLNISDKEVKAAQIAKNDKNGAFAKGIYIEHVEVDDADKWVAYYRANTDRYPEIG